MINRINLLAEILAIVLFLCGLYGEKFRLDFKEAVLIAADIIIMQGVDRGSLPVWSGNLIYPIIAVYCIWRFGGGIKKMIINNALYIIFLSGLQMLCFFLIFCLGGREITEEYRVLAVNFILLLFCSFLARGKILEKVSFYFQRKDIILRVILLISLGTIAVFITMKKESRGLYLSDYLFPAIAILIIFILTVSWQSYKLKAKEREMELRAYKLYEESYKNLITEIRLKQHEFNNHINAVYSQHLICKTYEELVNRQKEYCENILYDNRYEKLLRAGNSMLIGFLYGKFMEAEKKGITVEYEVKCFTLQTKLPMYKFIELTGNLLNNAMDALAEQEDKRLFVSITEEKQVVCIEVRNVHEVIPFAQITAMFQKDYSSKGENRGLGLYSLKKMGREYNFEIICSNKIVENINWISFCVQLEKSV